MRRIFIILSIVVFAIAGANAQGQSGFQNFMDKSEVHGSFEFDGAYYMVDEDIGFTEENWIKGQPFRFNGFGNIIYTNGNFSGGLRYEAYLPPLLGFDADLEGQGFPRIWASYSTEKFSFTVGGFYEQFGNGLTLRAFEEWMLGYDNMINGARVTFEPIKGLRFKGVYGIQRFFWYQWEPNTRGIIKGLDGELDFNQVFKGMQDSKIRFLLGLSAVSKSQVDDLIELNLPENVSNIGARFNMGIGKFNINTEYAWKVNDPSVINNFIYKDGQAWMFSLTYSTKGFGFFGMFKRYDNVSTKSDRYVTSNALDVSFLPPNTEIHTYMLTSMYPYATQPNGEIGFQFQVNYTIPRKSKLGGKYGTQIAVNYSQVNDIARDSVTYTDAFGQTNTGVGQPGSQGWTSPFFKFGDPVFWQDFNIEIDKRISKKLRGTFQYMYQTYNIDVLEGHPEDGPIVYSNIAVIDMSYRFNSKHTLRWELQGLWTQQDDGDWAAALLEYTISPNWFIAVFDQWNYGNPVEEDRNHYYNVSFGYTLRTTRLSINYGRQRDGIVCVGGVCRAVPASNGFYFVVSTNF
jgi:hypothetical protein